VIAAKRQKAKPPIKFNKPKGQNSARLAFETMCFGHLRYKTMRNPIR